MLSPPLHLDLVVPLANGPWAEAMAGSKPRSGDTSYTDLLTGLHPSHYHGKVTPGSPSPGLSRPGPSPHRSHCRAQVPSRPHRQVSSATPAKKNEMLTGVCP